jgi:prophage regulatory protein
MLLTMGRYLMGAKEIEERLGVSRQRVYQLTANKNFPEPYDEIAMGKVWRIEDIEAWIREHRKPLADSEPPTDRATPTRKGNRTPSHLRPAQAKKAVMPPTAAPRRGSE